MKRFVANTRGNAMLEMALVMVPLMFSIFAVEEIGRAMWGFHSLAMAIKKGARYAAVHGSRCVDASSQCQVTVADIAGVIQQNGVGLDMSRLQLTFTVDDSSETCGTSTACLSDSTAWPPSDHNAVGLGMTVKGNYSFNWAVPVLWPGHSPLAFTMSAKSAEVIEF